MPVVEDGVQVKLGARTVRAVTVPKGDAEVSEQSKMFNIRAEDIVLVLIGIFYPRRHMFLGVRMGVMYWP